MASPLPDATEPHRGSSGIAAPVSTADARGARSGFVPAAPEPIVATAQSPSGSVVVSVTDQGLPTSLRIDPRELRYGGRRIAEQIVQVAARATRSAAAARRDDLARRGMDDRLLDRLGLPTHDDVARIDAVDAERTGHPGWMRPL